LTFKWPQKYLFGPKPWWISLIFLNIPVNNYIDCFLTVTILWILTKSRNKIPEQTFDGNIDIYNHDLRKWSVDNYNYVEDAISEGLADGTDFHKSIQSGQYLKYQEDMNQELSDLSDAIEEALDV
jgi:hypothetical protein